MIFSLEGTIQYSTGKYIVLEVHGVSYKITVSKSVIDSVPEKAGRSKVFTHLYLRENAIELYGFHTKEELDFFNLLLEVQGVGPKLAIAILSAVDTTKVKAAIVGGHHEVLMIPGVGKKTAQKIIIELQNKIDRAGLAELDLKALKADEDVIDALISLGYKKKEVERVVAGIPKELASIKEKVKYVLSQLSEGTQ
jgi:Holliday junction DNA helicase RuvA